MRMILHDPQEEEYYGLNWASRLNDGETLETSTWDVPDGISQVEGRGDSINGTFTIIWLTGGTVGEEYDLVNHVVTSEDRKLDGTMKVTVINS
jgi:hypothetical protein